VTTDVLEGEVVSDETTFSPSLPPKPEKPHLMGHCQDAWDLPLTPDEEDLLHIACPGYLPPTPWPDPARKGATYQLPSIACSCQCHTRPLV